MQYENPTQPLTWQGLWKEISHVIKPIFRQRVQRSRIGSVLVRSCANSVCVSFEPCAVPQEHFKLEKLKLWDRHFWPVLGAFLESTAPPPSPQTGPQNKQEKEKLHRQ
eukprot:1160266-Pelagomonas_calceolata.AAC.6